jgi:hypothetical protein
MAHLTLEPTAQRLRPVNTTIEAARQENKLHVSSVRANPVLPFFARNSPTESFPLPARETIIRLISVT